MGEHEKRALTIQAAHTPGGIAYVKSERPVIAAIAANVCIGIIKFVAAFISGSSAMIAEGIHSIVDSANAGILLYGLRRSNRKADAKHPFGYSRELYFWTLIVGIMLFALGGGLSVYEGISRIREITPETTFGNPWLNYVILGVSMIVEGYALMVAVRTFNANRNGRRPLHYLREARDPSLFAVMIEDLSDELGLLFAMVGTLLAHLTGNLYFDAIASVLIGLLLTGMALTLLHETKALLIGRGMDEADLVEIKRIVEGHVGIESCTRVLSLYLGPDDLLLTIEATFAECDIATAIHETEIEVIERYPEVKRIFIEPQATV